MFFPTSFFFFFFGLALKRVFGWVGGEGTATTAEDQAIHFTVLYPLKSTNILHIKQPYLFFYPYATRTLRESKKKKGEKRKEQEKGRGNKGRGKETFAHPEINCI